MQFSKIATISAFAIAASAEFNSTEVPEEVSTITAHVTVTGYTTYCPYPTTITITVCDEETICTEKEIPVEEAATVTVTEPCIISSSVVEAPTLAPQNATTWEGGAAANVAGAWVGIAAIAVAML